MRRGVGEIYCALTTSRAALRAAFLHSEHVSAELTEDSVLHLHRSEPQETDGESKAARAPRIGIHLLKGRHLAVTRVFSQLFFAKDKGSRSSELSP